MADKEEQLIKELKILQKESKEILEEARQILIESIH